MNMVKPFNLDSELDSAHRGPKETICYKTQSPFQTVRLSKLDNVRRSFWADVETV